jgi:2-oxoglutarate ferredoxin oxidoreductase subunit gamma
LTRHPRFEIRIAGFGGQGVVTIGKILGTAFSVYGGKNSVNTQSYGPEARGGACRSEVVVCDGEINYPYVRKADVLIALSQVALDTYAADLKKDGILVIDTDAVKIIPAAARFRLFRIPTVALARQSGDVKYQNAVALGALYALISDLISEEPLLQALGEGVPSKTLSANLTAFEKGRNFVRSRFVQER